MSGWKAGAKEGKQASKQEGSVSARKLGHTQLWDRESQLGSWDTNN